jgi:putative FmdB family regulatory protein
MPTYEFECRECRRTFEVNVPVSEYAAMRREQRIVCPDCGAQKVTRVFNAPGIVTTSKAARGAGGCCCPGGQCR